VIEILVTDGYHPDRIEARAGIPIRLIFRRDGDRPGLDRVIFSRPKLERHLAPRSTTIVDLPPADGHDIRFTCGMGRHSGRIALVARPAPSASGRASYLLPFAKVAIVAAVVAVGALFLVPSIAILAIGVLGAATMAAAALSTVAVIRRRRLRSSRRS
jgi:hypothetical protein